MKLSEIDSTASQRPRRGGPPPAVLRLANTLQDRLGDSYAPGRLAPENREAFQSRVSSRVSALEGRRQLNLDAIALYGYDYANAEGLAGTNADIDLDWIDRFVRLAAEVSSQGMQQAWGRLLAAESSRPGRFSLSALDCLANMVFADLELWQRSGRLVLPTGYVIKPGGPADLEPFGLSNAVVLKLQALALLQDADDLSVTYFAPTKGITFNYRGADLILRHPDRQSFIVEAYKLTAVGLELLDPFALADVNVEYLRAIGQHMQMNDCDYRIRLADGSLSH